jgi:hypothetical protein
MNKKFLVSWVIVFIVWMVGSFLLHGMLLGDTYATMTNMMRPDAEQEAMMHYMLLAHILMAGGFVWIYQRGVEDKPWFQQGLRFGIAVAILAPVPTYMIYYTVQQTPGDLAIKQIIGDSIVVIIVALVAAFLNREAKAT